MSHDAQTRQAVVHQGAGQELARSLVIDEMLGKGLANALHDPTMDLAFERPRFRDEGGKV